MLAEISTLAKMVSILITLPNKTVSNVLTLLLILLGQYSLMNSQVSR